MKIDGKKLAQAILDKLKTDVRSLKKKEITPTMAIILMGDNEASKIYVRQKGIKAKEIGAEVKVYQTSNQTSYRELEKLVKKLDKNPKIHAVIIQRPAPENIDADALTELIRATKEVDGFGSSSKYPVPVAQATLLMIEDAFNKTKTKGAFLTWLKSKKIAVIGKGETAGKPIALFLIKKGIKPKIIDSQTKNRNKILKDSDIIISAVGKRVLFSKDIKKGAILIGVGLYTDQRGKLKGDYDDLDVEKVASFYSPTPGGVGPVNVACLLENLVNATIKQNNSL